MKRIVALIFDVVIYLAVLITGIFFLIFYPLEIGIPVFLSFLLLSLFACYIFIFIFKCGYGKVKDGVIKLKEQENIKN